MKNELKTDTEILENSTSIRSLAHSIKISSQQKILEGLRILGSSPDDEEITPRDFHRRAIKSENRYSKE
jgi:hypothetical protein